MGAHAQPGAREVKKGEGGGFFVSCGCAYSGTCGAF